MVGNMTGYIFFKFCHVNDRVENACHTYELSSTDSEWYLFLVLFLFLLGISVLHVLIASFALASHLQCHN